MLPESFSEQDLLTSIDSQSRLARVPMIIQGAIKLPKVRLLEKGGGNAPKFERKEVPVKTRDNSSTVVLRASTHRDAVSDFDKVQRNPGSFVRSWIHNSKSCPITSVGDTWDWNLCGPIVSGVMRVDLSVVSSLLKASGQKHSHHRWYFEPLRYDAPLSPPFDKLPGQRISQTASARKTTINAA